MITLIGPDWTSKRKLAHALAAAEFQPPQQLTVCWGAQRAEALNGQPRKDALDQLVAFQAAGLLCPDFTTNLQIARQWVRAGHLVFGRRQVHSQGTDIVGPRHPQWAKRDYWVKVVREVAQEWRLHSFLGRTIGRGLKVQTGPTARQMPVRNRRNGWTMIHTEEPTDQLRDAAKAAVTAVGYDFGAVDLLVANEQIYVLEINRAPGLDDYTTAAYAKAISKWARKQPRLPDAA